MKQGDLVTISADATYYTGTAIPDWVKKKRWKVKSVSGVRAVLGSSEDGLHNINSPVHTKFLTLVKTPAQIETKEPDYKTIGQKVMACVEAIEKLPEYKELLKVMENE